MLIGVFKSNQQLINIIAIIIIAVVWFSVLFFGDYVAPDFSLGIDWLNVLGGIVLIVFQVFFVSYVINEHKLLGVNTHLPSLLLITISCVSFFSIGFNRVILANTLIVVAFYQLLKLYNVANRFGVLFNAGILVGLASIIYFPSIVYFLFIWMVLIYISTPVWRDFAISLIGFILPLIYYVAYFFVFKNLSELVFLTEHTKIYELAINDLSMWQKTLLGFLSFLIIVSVFKLLASASRSVAKVRKMLIVVLMYLLTSGLSLFLSQFDFVATILLMIIPVAIILANLFQHIKKSWIAEVIYLALIGVIVLGYFS